MKLFLNSIILMASFDFISIFFLFTSLVITFITLGHHDIVMVSAAPAAPAPAAAKAKSNATSDDKLLWLNPNSFNYDQYDWPETCVGKLQSPINFPADSNLFNTTKIFKITEVKYNILNRIALEKYKDQVFMVNATTLGMLLVEKNGLKYQYDTKELIFHFPAEHSINYHYNDIEVQITHEKNTAKFKELNPNFTADPDIKFSRLIVSTLFDGKGISENSIIKSLKIDRVGQVTKLDLSSFPPKTKEFYFYEGSETVPSCRENVNWVVNKKIETMTKAQILYFVDWMSGIYGLKGNSRNVQNQYNRQIYLLSYPTLTSQTAGSNFIYYCYVLNIFCISLTLL